jgi:hypothetical protein
MLLFALLLSIAKAGTSFQTQGVVKPVKVSVTSLSANEDSKQLAINVRKGLRSLRYVVILDKDADWNVFLEAVKNDDACGGYSIAMLIVPKDSRPSLEILTARRFDTLAQHLVSKMEKEVFKPATELSEAK